MSLFFVNAASALIVHRRFMVLQYFGRIVEAEKKLWEKRGYKTLNLENTGWNPKYQTVEHSPIT